MKTSHRITKLDKKNNKDGYYLATIEFGTCDECSKELDHLQKAYLLEEYIILFLLFFLIPFFRSISLSLKIEEGKFQKHSNNQLSSDS